MGEDQSVHLSKEDQPEYETKVHEKMLKESDKSLFQELGTSTTENENECVDKWESRSEKKETISGVVPLDSSPVPLITIAVTSRPARSTTANLHSVLSVGQARLSVHYIILFSQ